MNRTPFKWYLHGLFIMLTLTILVPHQGFACTRVVYTGLDNTVITGRSMDWEEDTGTDLWAFPKGMQRDGACGANSLKWVSKYGSVICSFYNVGSVDGINETGLVANVLYLTESEYGPGDGKRPELSITAWAQYVLDTFSTVSEAVIALKDEPFIIAAPMLPNGRRASGHLAVSDPTGDSAVFEYVKGKLIVHHGKQYPVLTNSPTFDQQLALNTYWEQIGGSVFLPGTIKASDRFARAFFFINAIPKTADFSRSLASVFGVIRGVSVPLGITTPGQPNIASTYWRTVADHKNKVFYFDSAVSPTVFWVPLAELDLKEGAQIKKLPLAGGKTYSGSAAGQFEPAKAFEFLPCTTK